MTIFLIDVNSGYGEYSIPIIKKLCEFNSINLFVLKNNIPQNIYNVHPSWLKLFCHNLVDDDFIICWDLDLLPTKLFKLDEFFNENKINAGYDWSLYNQNTNEFTNVGFNHKFKYNCGLIGIPRSYSSFFSSIYDNALNSFYPSYEQYHVNDKIFDTNQDINILNPKINYFLQFDNIDDSVLAVHYTWKITSNQHRIELIKQHYETYKNNFNL
jgi:hypothetical protein